MITDKVYEIVQKICDSEVKPSTEKKCISLLTSFLKQKKFPFLEDFSLKDLISISVNYTNLNIDYIITDEKFNDLFFENGCLKVGDPQKIKIKNKRVALDPNNKEDNTVIDSFIKKIEELFFEVPGFACYRLKTGMQIRYKTNNVGKYIKLCYFDNNKEDIRGKIEYPDYDLRKVIKKPGHVRFYKTTTDQTVDVNTLINYIEQIIKHEARL